MVHLKKFREYLIGHPVTVRTDQCVLENILKQKTLSRRQYRYLDIIMEFDLSIEWIPGSKNMIADALS